ncbi:MAG TPA: hypothetical protein PKB10_14650, partial [Tepidisphaeraceae bacterium]|nr:hypothetical protein [Tepidisphaeraceae bacterium]
AKLARKTGCEMYGIDSEIDRFVHMTPSWREVVQVAREQYDGIVTSSHTHRVDFEKQLGEQDHWFRDLDVLGTSFYKPSTDRAEASVADRVAFLRPAVESYRRIAELLGRPIMFGEMGCTACTGAGQHPASWHGGASYDGQEQARHTEAVLESFWNEPWWAGCFWWKWDEHLDRPHSRADPAGDKGFTIYGKPAAQTLGAWFAKSRA